MQSTEDEVLWEIFDDVAQRYLFKRDAHPHLSREKLWRSELTEHLANIELSLKEREAGEKYRNTAFADAIWNLSPSGFSEIKRKKFIQLSGAVSEMLKSSKDEDLRSTQSRRRIFENHLSNSSDDSW